jgi:ubiquitin carboxyl-terminal hydrolase 25/28
VDKGGTESSNDTDATLVDDGPSRTGLPSHVAQSPEIPSSSVLGKRPRDQRIVMDVDDPLPQSPRDKDEFAATTIRNRASPEPMAPSTSQAEASSSKLLDRDRDGDVKMQGPSQKPAPPRKRTEQNDSTMMFGKHRNSMYFAP